jgi:hypothetical protein
MSIQATRSHHHKSSDNDCGCKDQDNATQKAITTERLKVCDLLYESAGNVSKQEKKFEGENKLFDDKKCMMKYTEENYRKYRNLDICAGTELVQTNESIKANVANYNKWNKDLNSTLKNLATSVKNAKSKFKELQEAACKLEMCYNDNCNTSQKRAITGIAPEDCKDEGRQLPEACKDSGKIFEELICMPKGMWADMDSIFKSSSDVVGIQVFSNIETLEPLQKTLDDYSKEFKKHLTDVVKVREGDMKKIQEDLVKSVQEITKAAMERNNARSDFEGYYDATEFLCCPDCDCIDKSDKGRYQSGHGSDKCNPRLKDCENEICDICEEVQETFCCSAKKEEEEKCAD